MRPKEGGASSIGAAAAPSDDDDEDDDDDDDDAQPLRLPSQQTAAVTAAKRAGRTLVSEVGAEDSAAAEQSEQPVAVAKRLPKRGRG